MVYVNEKALKADDMPIELGEIQVEMEDDLSDLTPIVTLNDDGTVEVNYDAGDDEGGDIDRGHDENLAEFLDDTCLGKIGADIADAVGEDITSSAEWSQAYLKGIELLGFKTEEKTHPFKGACGVFDPLMAEAVVRFQAMARGEFLPADGPVKVKVVGLPDERLDNQAERVKAWMNLYLTEGAPEYYEDTDQMLFYNAIVGSTFKKTYQDPIANRPKSDFIFPDQFVVNNSSSTLENCLRMTHIIPMNSSELRSRQLSGFYRDVKLVEDQTGNETDARQQINYLIGNDTTVKQTGGTAKQSDDVYTLYECHIHMNLEGYEHKDEDGEETGLPLPYIVTVDKESQKVLSIRRNWQEGDDKFKRIEYFTHFKFMPGLGFYGIGYAHILGGGADFRTKIGRQLVDSGTFKNFPAGVRAKGVRMENNNLTLQPGEFPEIETGGLPIDQVFKALPFAGPDMGLFQIYESMGNKLDRLASMTEVAVGEGRQDAPVGTTMALLEASMRVQSGVMKRLHTAFKSEFKKIARLFGEHLADVPYPFKVAGGEMHIMRQDFDDSVDVIPVSDPNITTSSQRIMRSEGILRIVQTLQPNMPEYQRNAVKMLFTQMNVENPDAYLPPLPQQARPLDPLSENQMGLMGMPLKAGEYQNHDAHIAAHMPLAQGSSTIAAHIQEHVAMKYRVMVQEKLGVQLPPMGTPLPPEVENEIAMMTAQAMQQLMGEEQGQNGAPQTPVVDPGFAMLQDSAAKVEIAKIKAQQDERRIQAEMTKEAMRSDDKARSDAVRLQTSKMNNITKLMTDDSSADKPLPVEVQR